MNVRTYYPELHAANASGNAVEGCGELATNGTKVGQSSSAYIAFVTFRHGWKSNRQLIWEPIGSHFLWRMEIQDDRQSCVGHGRQWRLGRFS
ncbi:MAG: hypothetical protein ACXWC3_29760, partial [Burkholderiales bacterium]